jgi:hypothetical protein
MIKSPFVAKAVFELGGMPHPRNTARHGSHFPAHTSNTLPFNRLMTVSEFRALRRQKS